MRIVMNLIGAVLFLVFGGCIALTILKFGHESYLYWHKWIMWNFG